MELCPFARLIYSRGRWSILSLSRSPISFVTWALSFTIFTARFGLLVDEDSLLARIHPLKKKKREQKNGWINQIGNGYNCPPSLFSPKGRRGGCSLGLATRVSRFFGNVNKYFFLYYPNWATGRPKLAVGPPNRLLLCCREKRRKKTFRPGTTGSCQPVPNKKGKKKYEKKKHTCVMVSWCGHQANWTTRNISAGDHSRRGWNRA